MTLIGGATSHGTRYGRERNGVQVTFSVLCVSQSQRALLALECELETIHAVLSGGLGQRTRGTLTDQFTVLYTEIFYWTVVRGGSERQRERGAQDGSGREGRDTRWFREGGRDTRWFREGGRERRWFREGGRERGTE